MAFNTRHRWVIARISEAFNQEVAVVEDFLRVPSNLRQLNDLFGTGPARLFVYLQVPDELVEVRGGVAVCVPGEVFDRCLS